MTRNTTNIVGIVITILAGTYFFMMYCDACQACKDRIIAEKKITTDHSGNDLLVYEKKN